MNPPASNGHVLYSVRTTAFVPAYVPARLLEEPVPEPSSPSDQCSWERNGGDAR